MANLVGKSILHYKILEQVGQGGMGVVYKAEDKNLKRVVAIKFLPHQISASDEERERFKIEAQAAAALNHNNIATIYSTEETDDEAFIVMEYIAGREIRDLIGEGPLTLEMSLDLSIQIARGLQAAHEKGIVHRDIKSANVMVTEQNQAKIMDFGLAQVAGGVGLTQEHSTLGTAPYMSPEQTRGEPVDQRSDIWSLGVLIYEMISGQLPFKGNYDQAILYAIMNEEPTDLSQLRDDVPEKLEEITKKALQKELGHRYQSVQELLDDLEMIGAEVAVRKAGPDKKKTPSIAVLPFVNQSADPENEYFSDGLAEEIINALSKLKHLQVAARTSSFSFKGKEEDIRNIARKLKVDHVLEGSVRKAGNRIRITAQLIYAKNGYQVWSDRYDRELDDIFAIQDEISLAIIEELKVQIMGEEKEAVVERGTESVEAYELYLKGRYYWNQRGEGLSRGLGFFQQAVAVDSEFVLAHVGLADAYALLGFYGVMRPDEAMPKAKAAAVRAIDLDDGLAEAHSALAFVSTFYDRDWPSAKKQFQHALTLDPRCVTAHYWFALYLTWVEGKWDEGLAQARKATKIDPLGLNPTLMVALILIQQEKYSEAIAELLKALKQDPSAWLAHRYLGICYKSKGMLAEGIEALENALLYSGRHQWILADLANSLVAAGKSKEAKALQDELNELSNRSYVSSVSLSMVALELGQIEEGLTHLEHALEDGDGTLLAVRYWPIGFPALRGDPRFEDLLRRIGWQV